jgi:putative endonuclease
MSYYFYILRCSDSSLYCGQTNNLERRIKEHNTDKNKSAKYLRGKTPVKLVYFEKHKTPKEAMKREQQVKKWTRVKKEVLVKGDKSLLKKL